MRAILFLLLALFTWYLAAMYRSLPLLALGGTELLLGAALWIMARRLKKRLHPLFAQKQSCAEADEMVILQLDSGCQSRLPVSRLDLKLRIGYRNGKRCSRWASGCCRRESGLDMPIPAELCGLLEAELTRMRVYDCLAIFHAGKKLKSRTEAAIFPPMLPLAISWPAAAWTGAAQTDTLDNSAPRPLPGEPSGELRQLRPYQPGDPLRHIHWNLTARQGELWVKEFQQETAGPVRLILERPRCRGKKRKKRLPSHRLSSHRLKTTDLKRLDRFYRLTAAVTMGLLTYRPSVQLWWADEEEWVSAEVSDEASLQAALLQLYQTKPAFAQPPPCPAADDKAFRLDGALCWYEGSRLIRRFPEKNLDEALISSEVVL